MLCMLISTTLKLISDQRALAPINLLITPLILPSGANLLVIILAHSLMISCRIHQACNLLRHPLCEKHAYVKKGQMAHWSRLVGVLR